MISNRRRIYSWTPALTGMVLIFWASSIPGNELHIPLFLMSDKVFHFIAYTGLGWLISLRMLLRGNDPLMRAQGIPMALGPVSSWIDRLGQITGVLYAASDEIHQNFVYLRQASVLDWSADSLGILAGSWICRKMFRKRLGQA
jgi:hypothetical protein